MSFSCERTHAIDARGRRAALAAALLAGFLSAALGGCVSTPPDPAAEELDRETGVTLIRMPRPMELVATVPRAKGADPFAYAAPFAANRMGSTSYYLWIAVPGDFSSGEPPRLYVDGEVAPLRPIPPDLRQLGLSAAPYQRPAPWTAEYYFSIDANALQALAAGRDFAVVVRSGAAEEERFEGPAARELRGFYQRLVTN